MKKLKVMTVVGTRPEIIRLSRVIPKLDQYTEQILVHTGQNYDYELNEIFFESLSLRRPDHQLEAAGKSGVETIGKVIIAVDDLLKKEKPEALLVLGDTNSCMAALPAKRRKIPVFHMEAGNRCFDQRVPEEINRRMVDHLADVNLTYSSIAREYLLREGLPADLTIKTGSPMREVLDHYLPEINSSDVLTKLKLKAGEFFLVSAHREENIESDSSFEKLINILNGVAKTYQLPVIVSTHPRTAKKLKASGLTLESNVMTIKPLGFCDYNHLQLSAKATLSDSGTINEESSLMNFPALNIREAHERPEAVEEGGVMMVGLSLERVLQGLMVLESSPRGDERLLPKVEDYDVANVSDKVVRIIHSYTDYVKRVVWQEK
jgi:UDP-N-acetyl-L-fucosamine synthase